MGNGLEIMLDIQQDEYLPIWKETSELLCHTEMFFFWSESCKVIPYFLLLRSVPAQAVKLDF